MASRLRSFIDFRVILLCVTIVILVGASLAVVQYEVNIRSTGVLPGAEITARSGSAADIQAAVNEIAAVTDRGRVRIPAGTFNFVDVGEPWRTVNVPAGIDILGTPTEKDANGQVLQWQTVLVMPWDVPGSFGGTGATPPWWVRIIGSGDPDRPSRFSDIKLVGYRSVDSSSTTVHFGISIENVVDFRVDHCCFEHVAGRGIGTWGLRCRGVIDHNRIYNIYGYDVLTNYARSNIGYGVTVGRSYNGVTYDPTMSVLGKYTNYTVFIEDNYFSKWRHCVSAGHGGYYVFRHNIIDGDFGHFSLDVHGLRDIEAGRAGGRGCEVYENSFTNVDLGPPEGATEVRGIMQDGGGCGVFFNNYIDSTYRSIALYPEDGVSSEIWHLEEFYLWSSKGSWVPAWDGIPSGFTADRNVLADWSRSAGNEGELGYPNVDPSWSIEGYMPYVYPHPLTVR